MWSYKKYHCENITLRCLEKVYCSFVKHYVSLLPVTKDHFVPIINILDLLVLVFLTLQITI